MENWMRDPRKFQLTSGPRGKYVYHRSPSGRKVTRNVPNSVMTKNDAVRFLRQSGGRGAPRLAPTPGGPKFIMIGGRKVPTGPKLPNQPLDCAALSHLSGMKKIGSGRQGIIYAANRRSNYVIREIAIKVSPFDKAAAKRGEKQPAEVEYKIQDAVRRVAQGGVVSSMQLVECRDFVSASNMNNINKIGKNIDPHRQFVLFMERANDGSLAKWIKANASRLTDSDLMRIIAKVLSTLYRIAKTYPEFRHNDMHLENILMNKGEPKIADFGWSRIQKTGTNPAVNTALKNGTAAKFGIGPNTDPRYDTHLFLNELRRYLIKFGKFTATVNFLNKYIPSGYREFEDTYTHEGRLRYDMAFPGLPTLRTILKDPLLKVKLTPSPARSANSNSNSNSNANVARPAPKPKSPSPRKNYTNANFLAMTPRQFLKLSPATRARAAAVRKANKGKGPAGKGGAKVNATAKRMPSPKRLPSPPKVRISPRTLRSNKFNRLVVSLLNMNNSVPYQNRWNAARTKAMNVVKGRLAGGKPAFSPSPVRRQPSPARRQPTPPRPRLPSPLSPLGPPPTRRSPSGVVRSAGSGRYKVVGPSGRLVYANGAAVPMNFIKALASRKGVSIKGLRSKEAIAKAIFNRK
jgi:hypothetical protein